jgi:hypothetical protein
MPVARLLPLPFLNTYSRIRAPCKRFACDIVAYNMAVTHRLNRRASLQMASSQQLFTLQWCLFNRSSLMPVKSLFSFNWHEFEMHDG